MWTCMANVVLQSWQLQSNKHGNYCCQCMATSFFQYQNLDSISMAAAVLHTWQLLLPIHGNQYILASKLLYSRLELTRQMRSIISAAHMLLAIGKSRRQYMSHCTRPLVSVFCLIFFHHHCYKSYFPHMLFPQKQMQCCFCGSNFLTLLCRMCPSCVVSHQIDVLCLQSVKLAMRRLPR